MTETLARIETSGTADGVRRESFGTIAHLRVTRCPCCTMSLVYYLLSLNLRLITIDGPVAVGKSSVGLLLAEKLGFLFFDTGVIYRTFTWKALNAGLSA
jgi:hypothetical protein